MSDGKHHGGDGLSFTEKPKNPRNHQKWLASIGAGFLLLVLPKLTAVLGRPFPGWIDALAFSLMLFAFVYGTLRLLELDLPFWKVFSILATVGSVLIGLQVLDW
ncbi:MULTISPECIES: hypothetical protein [Pseudomonas]|uniref:hypothetical protein n=1 Tax=Pseudomonas TaxID=286 RepID=UPI0029140B3C|nr:MULTISPECIES: hypothetical protein [Pseudomonas]MDU8545697.1 hypothetical protein [Pseudomonas syringae group sp. J248-6]WPP02624.1 hypothetical protein SFA35_26355 [Pseudomonas sp. HR96]